MLNRRHLFAAPAVVAVMATPAVASASGTVDYARQEAAALKAIEDRINAEAFDDAAWEAWEDRHKAFMDWAEALPLTPENAEAKALAFKAIYPDDLDQFLGNTQETRDVRLAFQIVKIALGISR